MRIVSVTAFAIVLFACASQTPQKEAASAPATKEAPRGDAFAVVRIDDEVDPLGAIEEDALPPKSGMALFGENTLIGGEKVVQRRFMRIVMREKETPDGACGRFLQWVQSAHIALPADHRFACESIESYDESTHTATIEAVRSYVLAGAPILTEHDVVDAYVGDDKSDEVDLLDVAVKLSPEGRAKLKAATGEWTHRRLAVVANDWIDSAPLLKGQIDTDTLTIAFGPRSPAELDRAQAFVSRLRGK